MTYEEAQISFDRANEIEEWLKTEYSDIHVDHLRDCGTKIFWFTDPAYEYRCVGLIQIPVSTTTYHDEETGRDKCYLSFNKVIFNVTDQEYPMDIFYKIFQSNKQFIRDYIENCRKENKCAVIKLQHKPYSFDDAIKDLQKEMQDEMDRELVSTILAGMSRKNKET